MAGVGSSVSIDVLLRDFNRTPLSHQWVVLASRWFTKLQDMAADRLAHNAWISDIQLMLDGCRDCWTHKLLHTLSRLGVVDELLWNRARHPGVTISGVKEISISEPAITEALSQQLSARWQGLHDDPRNAPSSAHERCIHAAWILPLAHVPRTSAHLKLCMSFKMLQCLARYRLGWHYLETHSARLKRRPVVPWSERWCRLCSVPHAVYCSDSSSQQGGQRRYVEDLKHFLLECPAYTHIRTQYPTIFPLPPADTVAANVDTNGTITSMFADRDQANLATCLYTMTRHRDTCLALAPGSSPPLLDANFGDDIELLRIG